MLIPVPSGLIVSSLDLVGAGPGGFGTRGLVIGQGLDIFLLPRIKYFART